MGLFDILNGMQNGPRGQPQPTPPGAGGMSKMTMAMLALLAYKAYKSLGSSQPAQAGSAPARYPTPESNQSNGAPPGGSLTDLLRGIFGGARSMPGNVLSRGVGNLVEDLRKSGQGVVAQSWVDKGPNRAITPDKLAAALGDDAIRDLTEQTGMERDELLAALSEHLPRVIDHLTPEGRLPTEQEASRLA